MRDDTTTAALATGPDIDIDLRFPRWRKEIPDIDGLCRRAAASALAVAPAGVAVEVSIVLADDDFVQALNRTWRHVDAPTNVLAFPCEDAGEAATARVMLGDVVVAFQTTRREAAEGGLPLDHHLSHLLVHGVLHLLGHDHEHDDEAGRMERLEAEALARMGIADPYADRTD